MRYSPQFRYWLQILTVTAPSMDVATRTEADQASAASSVSDLCHAFETQLREGLSPSIEQALSSVGEADRDSAFVALLELEVNHLRSRGQTPDSSSYANRFPAQRLQIDRVFGASDDQSVCGSAIQSMESTLDRHVPPGGGDLKLPGWDVGSSVGRYRLVVRLGKGGFGEVWQAFDPELNRMVAVKLPRPDRLFFDEMFRGFQEEARKVASLRSPHIVAVYDVGRIQQSVFLVSELIDGETLAQRAKRDRLDHSEAVRIAAEVARGLQIAHQTGIVHRDIKPPNIMLRKDGSAAVTDFGLAISEQDQVTEGGAVVGTIAYMSPEQARGASDRVDGRSDIYSLGVVLFELLTRRLPFAAERRSDYWEQILYREVRSLRSVDQSVPAELERIVLKCLMRSPSERYATAAELANDLESWLEDQHANPTVDRRRRLLMFSLTGSTLAAFVFAFMRRNPEKQTEQDRLPVAVEPPPMNAPPPKDRWLPLLGRPHTFTVWLPGDATRDKLVVDPLDQTLHASNSNNHWITSSEISTSGPFRVRLVTEVLDRAGRVGVAWAIRQDTRAFPKEKWLCYCLKLIYLDRNRPTKLTLAELTTDAFLNGQQCVKMVDPIESYQLPQQADVESALEIEVSEQSLKVFMGGQLVWQPELPDAVLAKIATNEGFIGFTGLGKSVTIRQASIMFPKDQ